MAIAHENLIPPPWRITLITTLSRPGRQRGEPTLTIISPHPRRSTLLKCLTERRFELGRRAYSYKCLTTPPKPATKFGLPVLETRLMQQFASSCQVITEHEY